MSDIVGWYIFFAIMALLALFSAVLFIGETIEQRRTYRRVMGGDDENGR